ncbi:hypothetical protein TNCV_2957241 [Trichonephila clavipes]|nr:hypothetical protein TNCV_2957241 [Trichonephila clavipes]
MNGLIEIGIDQDVSWSTNEWIRWIDRDGLDSWVVVPIDVTEEVNCNFSDTLSDGSKTVSDRPCNFEPQPSDEDSTSALAPNSPKIPTTPT